jgi:hypothetical protein
VTASGPSSCLSPSTFASHGQPGQPEAHLGLPWGTESALVWVDHGGVFVATAMPVPLAP